jgi:hypothetical protein
VGKSFYSRSQRTFFLSTSSAEPDVHIVKMSLDRQDAVQKEQLEGAAKPALQNLSKFPTGSSSAKVRRDPRPII